MKTKPPTTNGAPKAPTESEYEAMPYQERRQWVFLHWFMPELPANYKPTLVSRAEMERWKEAHQK